MSRCPVERDRPIYVKRYMVAALRMLAERPVEWKKLMKRLHDHKAKLAPTHQISNRKAERTVQLAELRLAALKRRRAMFPPCAQRQIGSLRDMPDIDALMKTNPDVVVAAASKMIALIEAKMNP